MLGFADIEDDDMLTLEQISSRMDYRHAASLRRAIKRDGQSLPPAIRRGRYRGADVKDWYAGLVQKPIPEPAVAAPENGNIYNLEASRARLRERIGMV
jgi:hypothetical protein